MWADPLLQPLPHPQPGAHPGPLQGRGLHAGLGALLQARGVTPHVPVGGQTPAWDTKGKVTPEGNAAQPPPATQVPASPVGWGGVGRNRGSRHQPASPPTWGLWTPPPFSCVVCGRVL